MSQRPEPSPPPRFSDVGQRPRLSFYIDRANMRSTPEHDTVRTAGSDQPGSRFSYIFLRTVRTGRAGSGPSTRRGAQAIFLDLKSGPWIDNPGSSERGSIRPYPSSRELKRNDHNLLQNGRGVDPADRHSQEAPHRGRKAYRNSECVSYPQHIQRTPRDRATYADLRGILRP